MLLLYLILIPRLTDKPRNQEANGVKKIKIKCIKIGRQKHVNIKYYERYRKNEILIYFLENDTKEIIKIIQKIRDLYPPNSIIRFFDYKRKPIQDYQTYTIQNEDIQVDEMKDTHLNEQIVLKDECISFNSTSSIETENKKCQKNEHIQKDSFSSVNGNNEYDPEDFFFCNKW